MLVVDDEPANNMLLKEYLENSNIKILWAEDGYQAVEMCKNNFDILLVLMDLKLPHLNGYESARLIKKSRPQLPIIIQSAYLNPYEKNTKISKYINGYLEKPIRYKELHEVLKKNLKG
jgi:CheY-like chemotaxis protein